MEGGEGEGKTLLDAMRDGVMDGMQHFDGEIEKLVREGVITPSTALLYATNAGNFRLQIADVMAEQSEQGRWSTTDRRSRPLGSATSAAAVP